MSYTSYALKNMHLWPGLLSSLIHVHSWSVSEFSLMIRSSLSCKAINQGTPLTEEDNCIFRAGVIWAYFNVIYGVKISNIDFNPKAMTCDKYTSFLSLAHMHACFGILHPKIFVSLKSMENGHAPAVKLEGLV